MSWVSEPGRGAQGRLRAGGSPAPRTPGAPPAPGSQHLLPPWQIKRECLACRGAAAAFNMSYFGKFYLVGPDAGKAADWLFSADVSRPPGTRSGSGHAPVPAQRPAEPRGHSPGHWGQVAADPVTFGLHQPTARPPGLSPGPTASALARDLQPPGMPTPAGVTVLGGCHPLVGRSGVVASPSHAALQTRARGRVGPALSTAQTGPPSRPGSTVYTCMLNARGGTESDLTVSRLAPGPEATPLAPRL